MSLLDTLTLPFQFEFMVTAFVITLLVAVPAALLSCFLVLKGWSLMGDATSHAVLPGVVGAYILGLPLGVGAFVAGMVCAVSVGFIQDNSRVKRDTVMGVVFSGMFGLGIVMYTKIQTDVHLDHILFGDMLGVDWGDVLQTGIIAVIVTGALIVKWRDLVLHAFDPVEARAIGLRVGLLHYGLLCLLSLSIVAALKAVGIILAVAILIAPGAIACLLTRRFAAMMLTAVAVATGSSFFGIYLAFFIDSAPAPTIVLLMTLVFIGATIFSSRRAAQATASPGG